MGTDHSPSHSRSLHLLATPLSSLLSYPAAGPFDYLTGPTGIQTTDASPIGSIAGVAPGPAAYPDPYSTPIPGAFPGPVSYAPAQVGPPAGGAPTPLPSPLSAPLADAPAPVFGGGMAGAHHSFLASVIAHLLGAAGGIHGFGPGGAVGGGAHSNLPSLPSPGIGPAQALHGLGANAQAAQVWEQHHPGAMAGRAPIPHWVTQSLLAAIHAHTPQQAAPAPTPSFQAQ